MPRGVRRDTGRRAKKAHTERTQLTSKVASGDGSRRWPPAGPSSPCYIGRVTFAEMMEFVGSRAKNVALSNRSYQKWIAVGGARL